MNDKKRTARYWMAFLILAVFLIILFIWNVNAGSIHLSVNEILNIIFRHQGDATAYNIIWEIRLPRILAVIILGGALSVSGFLLQTFFNNPIAGPFVLGISSGAKLVVALLMIFSEQIYLHGIRSYDHCGIYRFHDLNGICAAGRKKSPQHVHACHQWRYDRLYLLCNHRFCGYIC